MEVSGRRHAYSEDWDTGIACDPCQIDNVSENALFYCTNCDEFLCDNCAIHHRKSKASRQHQLLDRNEMPRKKLYCIQERFCAKHDGKLVEYFCGKHEACCCSVCVTLDHGLCGVRYIGDLAKGFSSSQEYKSLLNKIKDIETDLTSYKNETQNDSIDVTNCFRRLKSDIQVFRTEINLKIDEFEVDLMKQAEQIKKEDLKAIESVDTLYDKLKVNMSEISSTLGRLEKCKQNQQLFISAQKARTQVKAYNDKVLGISQKHVVKRYAFSRNEDIMKTLNSRKLGSIEMTNEGDGRTKQIEQKGLRQMKEDSPDICQEGIRITEERRENQKAQDEEKPINDTLNTTKFKFAKDIQLKDKADRTKVGITGSVLVSNNLLAVADCPNSSIKVIDLRSDTITCNIKLDNLPYDITCMDPRTLVVTCHTYLVFLRYDGKLSVVKKVPMESGCSGITYNRNMLFVTFKGKQPSVKILNKEGKVLQTFQHNDKGQNLFSEPEYITFNRDGNIMYVSDWGQHTVTSLSMDVKVCHIYKHDSLNYPKGLTLGDDDNIYVAGYMSHNIHQITPTCKHSRIVLEGKDGLSLPRTLLYHNKDKTLYAGNDSFRSNPLNVYKLE